MDVFAWSATNMPGIDPYFLFHRLIMDEKVKPVVQNRRKINEEKCLAIKDDTQKLLIAGHVREIFCDSKVGMLLAKELRAHLLLAKSNSLLITGQISREYPAKAPQLASYLKYVKTLRETFSIFYLVHVPKEQNS